MEQFMRTPIIAGNWKMHGTKTSVAALLDGLRQGYADIKPIEWVVFPPFVFLDQIERVLADTAIYLIFPEKINK